jgi:lipopolysaccharide transport system ATP-binding protein
MAAAITFDNVWKKFRRGQAHDSLKDLIPHLIKNWGRGEALDAEEFWAVRDVSFEVQPGEALGIIGPNGAGKSTSLKLLSRILRPTKGHCELRGRVGALIEVAAGFHPDLTGRENIFLQGAIMGMSGTEIRRYFDEIVDFAEVAAFIDTPVKRYSSGMHARLGFAVAAHLHPDVLLIDEVLSVGDMEFQRRCVARANQFKKQGVAIVFVSHNLQAVTELCDNALFLAGEAKAYGPAQQVIETYLTSLASAEAVQGAIAIESTELLDVHGTPTQSVEPGDVMRLRLSCRVYERVSGVTIGFAAFRSTDGLKVYDTTWAMADLGVDDLPPGETFTVDFDYKAHLTRGHYFLDTGIFDGRTHTEIARRRPAAVFSVDETATRAGVAGLNARATGAWNRRGQVAGPNTATVA